LEAYKNGDYAKSSASLKSLINLGENLASYALLMQDRIKLYEKDGFPDNWEGIYIATDK